MAELKTKVNDSSVEAFLNSISDEKKRKDCVDLVALIKKITKEEPKMWGASIVGFGNFRYKYDSGHGGETALVGFSPRKQNITFYLMGGFHGHDALMKKLGKYKTGKGCLYINSLEEVDIEILRTVIEVSINFINRIIESKKQKKK